MSPPEHGDRVGDAEHCRLLSPTPQARRPLRWRRSNIPAARQARGAAPTKRRTGTARRSSQRCPLDVTTTAHSIRQNDPTTCQCCSDRLSPHVDRRPRTRRTRTQPQSRRATRRTTRHPPARTPHPRPWTVEPWDHRNVGAGAADRAHRPNDHRVVRLTKSRCGVSGARVDRVRARDGHRLAPGSRRTSSPRAVLAIRSNALLAPNGCMKAPARASLQALASGWAAM